MPSKKPAKKIREPEVIASTVAPAVHPDVEKLTPSDRAIREREVKRLQAELDADDGIESSQGRPGN